MVTLVGTARRERSAAGAALRRRRAGDAPLAAMVGGYLMAFPIGAALTAGSSVVGGLLGKSAAGDAADAQLESQREALGLQREQFETTREDFAPFRESAGRADAALAYELGLAPRPQRQGWESIPQVERVRRQGGG